MTTIVYFFIHIYLIAGKKAFLGSGEEIARLRGEGCSAPGRKLLGTGEEVLFRRQASEYLPGPFSLRFQAG